MSMEGRRFQDTRWLQIGLLVVLAVVLMVGAAYFFGTGLRADTSASVAPSPRGSSLTAVRESRLDDYYARFSSANAAAMSAAASNRMEDYYFRATAPSATGESRSESLDALAARWAPFQANLDQALQDAGARPRQADRERWTLP